MKQFNPAASVGVSPVDLCMKENCEAGCTNQLVVKNTPLVVSANATSLVGVDSYIVAQCTCKVGTASINCRIFKYLHV